MNEAPGPAPTVSSTVTVWDGGRAFVPPTVPAGRYHLLPDDDAGGFRLVRLPDPERPYRVVDRFGRGWLTCNPHPETYPGDIVGVDDFETLERERGPLVVVGLATDDEEHRILNALAQAGTKAVASAFVAVYRVMQECQERDGHRLRIVAGRPGSWESVALPRYAEAVAASIPQTLVGAGRVDPSAVSEVEAVVRSWVFGGDRFVEVAETMEELLGRLVDGRGGWNQVSENWLRALRSGQLREFCTYRSRWHSTP